MLSIIFLLAVRRIPAIERDAYGVAHIHAASLRDAFYQAGFAVAEDRLWQMEMSRRLARGKLSEVLGKATIGSDREILTTGYTDEELETQFAHLSARARAILSAYAEGVNGYIQDALLHTLPEGYAKNGFKPEPWTELDSMAIGTHLLDQFGRGGAGAIRNLAILAYLKGQKAIGTRALDVWDDMAWFNDSDAVPTVSQADDPLAASHYRFYRPDRKTTEAHLAMLPKMGLMELMGGIRISSREESTRVAENLAAPFHSGSYCVVVSPSRSATGQPVLLSGPQMGTTIPSVAHEMSIETPGLSVVGMDVPGVPGIVIGHTKTFAWGLTSGVADTDDIFFFPSDGTTYKVDARNLPIVKLKRTIKVKGGDDVTVVRSMTVDGPVVMNGAKTIFAKKSSYWMHQMDTFDAWLSLWSADSPDSIEKAMSHATMNFNFFYATVGGDVGWRYVGLIPKRAEGVDPRFPTPGLSKFAWKGMLSPSEMPHVRNPRAGFLANWNNKPVDWWPNGDTPAWGKIFRNSALLATLRSPKLTAQDLEMSAWWIARLDENWSFFKPFVALGKGSPGYQLLAGYDGKALDGSRQASNFEAFLPLLRQEVFQKTTGSFLSPEFFNLVLQPSYLLRALERKTKFDYLGKSSPRDVVCRALARLAAHPAPPFVAPSFRAPTPPAVPYSDRGTYIQIVELLKDGPYGRNVLPPGVAESRPHSEDQIPLARAWLYKPMHFR